MLSLSNALYRIFPKELLFFGVYRCVWRANILVFVSKRFHGASLSDRYSRVSRVSRLRCERTVIYYGGKEIFPLSNPIR
jgi:hypothetical protein